MRGALTFLLSITSILCCVAQQNLADGFSKDEAQNQLVNGLREGKWVEYVNVYGGYAKNSGGGTYYVLTEYHNGKPTGVVRKYYMQGSLESKTFYRNDSIVKRIDYFYEGGPSTDTILPPIPTIPDNEFYTDGKVILPPAYLTDSATGVEKVYYEKGKLKSEIPYNKGVVNGVVKTYYKDGSPEQEVPYAKGKKNGVEKRYYNNGKTWWEYPYTDGRKNGVSKYYNKDGNLLDECPFSDGRINGVWKSYYNNGKPETERPFINGIEDGTDKTYDEKGRLTREVIYSDGRAIKTVNYDKNGKEIK